MTHLTVIAERRTPHKVLVLEHLHGCEFLPWRLTLVQRFANQETALKSFASMIPKENRSDAVTEALRTIEAERKRTIMPE